MNDLLKNNTNPKNIEELYYRILKIVELRKVFLSWFKISRFEKK